MMSNKVRMIALALACVIGFAYSVNAFEAGSASQKMVNTKSAVAVAPEQWEVDLTLEKSRHIGTPYYDNSWGKESREKMRLWDWTVTAKYGLQEGTDVFVSGGWFDLKDRAYGGAMDDYERGLKDITVGLTQELESPMENVALAYIPELVIPVGRDAELEAGGRLGLGRDFWELNQTLAATMHSEVARVNANLSHSIPFGRTREYYSTPFMRPRENVRGITELGVEAAMPNESRIEPMVNMNYAHEWISSDNDSDLITAGVGAKVQFAEGYNLLVGYDYPVAGRNSTRIQSWKVGITGSF